MDTAFESGQFARVYPDGIDAHYWTRARNEIILRKLQSSVPAVEKRRILEIGCGRGIPLAFLRERELDVWGVDLAHASAYREDLGPYVFYGKDAFDLEVTFRTSIQVILLLDVIEHIGDASLFLRQCVAAFPQCRFLLITVPARQELWSNWDAMNGHVCRYDLRALRRLADASGLTLREHAYFFHGLYLPARAMSALRIPRREMIRPPGRNSRWLHRVLASLFVLEQRVFPDGMPGTSLLAVWNVSDA